MALNLIAASTGLPVSLSEIKSDLNIDFNSDDERILRLIKRATAQVEADSGKCLFTQQWQEVLSYLPCSMELKKAPLQTVDSITYYNASNQLTTLGSSTLNGPWYTTSPYYLPGTITFTSYPATYCRPDAVKINYTAGYTVCPEQAKQAISLLVGHWNENREAVGNVGSEIALGYRALVNSLKSGGYW